MIFFNIALSLTKNVSITPYLLMVSRKILLIVIFSFVFVLTSKSILNYGKVFAVFADSFSF